MRGLRVGLLMLVYQGFSQLMVVSGMASEGPWKFLKPLPDAVALRDVLQRDVTKITIVGVGNVGMACAYSILSKELCRALILVDVVEKLEGEVMDLQHASAFTPNVHICASRDYEATTASQVCIITAGAKQESPDESRISLVHKNAALMSKVVPELVKRSPDALFLVVSNPVDILAYLTWKISGLPSNRVIGSGTNLDLSRFRFLMGRRLDIDAKQISGYIIGEHGDSSLPVWSGVNVAGVPLLSYIKQANLVEELNNINEQVVQSAYEVIRLKGYTNWAIGASVADIVRSLTRDQRSIHPVSVLCRGLHGIEREVFLSLPCVLGRNGVVKVVEQPLSEDEYRKLHEAASSLWSIIKDVTLH